MGIKINKKQIGVIVSSAEWEEEIYIECDVFEDVLTEACTRILENNIKEPTFKIFPILYVRYKNDDIQKNKTFNTYKILINASMYSQAEIIRKNFLKDMGVDLNDEPLHSK